MKTTIIPPHSLAQTSQAHCMRRPFLGLCVSLLHYFVPVTLPFNGVSEAVCTNFYYACIFQQRVRFKAIDILRREQIEQSSCVFGIALTLLLHLCESTTLSKNKNIRNSKYISQEKEIKKTTTENSCNNIIRTTTSKQVYIPRKRNKQNDERVQ